MSVSIPIFTLSPNFLYASPKVLQKGAQSGVCCVVGSSCGWVEMTSLNELSGVEVVFRTADELELPARRQKSGVTGGRNVRCWISQGRIIGRDECRHIKLLPRQGRPAEIRDIAQLSERRKTRQLRAALAGALLFQLGFWSR